MLTKMVDDMLEWIRGYACHRHFPLALRARSSRAGVCLTHRILCGCPGLCSLFWSKEMELTMLGLQGAGKTTLVNVIAVRSIPPCFNPTHTRATATAAGAALLAPDPILSVQPVVRRLIYAGG